MVLRTIFPSVRHFKISMTKNTAIVNLFQIIRLE